MNELHFAYKVKQHLNSGLHELDTETTTRLAAARQSALAHQKQPVQLSVLATAGNFVLHHVDNFRVKQTLAAFAILFGIIFSTFWIAEQRITELGDLDSALLSDDLPIGAFTDQGFDTWLKRGSSE